MGWKGTVRSVGAAYRAAERDSNRRHRELQKREKAYAKMQMLEQAAYDVDSYENHIDRLTSLHKECSSGVNWHEISAEPEPSKPIPSRPLESKAIAKEVSYKPNFIDRLFGLEKRKRAKLALNIQKAITQDEEHNNKAEKEWKEAHDEWAFDAALAERVLNGDPQAKIYVIKQLDPFSELIALGSKLSFHVRDDGLIECDLSAHGSTVIPSEIKSLLSSGKLSVKKMPITKFNELFQDYVCSSALRIANELFSILPGEMVVVTVMDDVLNTRTGHLEELPILSAAISRDTISKMNIQTIDPSDSMRNFIHHMNFKKASGFNPVKKLGI
jgi:hypothetical protein